MYNIILYYKYTHIADPVGFMDWHRELCTNLNLKGRVLIAHEGINGTLEGSPENIQTYCDLLHKQDGSETTYGNFGDVIFKVSEGDGTAFPKLKIKVRDEIVTTRFGNVEVDPTVTTGIHLKPEELHEWIQNGEDFEIIDMRNTYEYKVGHFKGSIDPGMDNFYELPKVVKKLEHLKEKKVITVCTGGIRCEKASGYLMKKGFTDVYQLDGGIVKYMEKYPGKNFDGALFVFDNRLTMDTTKDRAVVGTCIKCDELCERFTNCANDECHYKFICCENCEKTTSTALYCPKQCQKGIVSKFKALLKQFAKKV